MLRFAQFGAGRIGAIHAANLAATRGTRLLHVVDVDAAAARTLADRHGAKVSTAAAALADPAVDAVIIASSTDTHAELAIASARAGKAIFCEKPVDLSLKRVDACLAAVGLAHAADRRLGDFSGGMRQRVGIAQALLNEPRLLIVDEPTVGLDPEERLRFRQILTELAVDRLVILSTHIVSDVDSSADRIAVMRSGRLLAHVTPGELIARAAGQVWRCTIGDGELPALRERHPVSHVERADGGLRVHVIARVAPRAGAESIAPALEDAYLACLHLADAA